MNIEQMEYMLILEQEKKIYKAAEKCYISQSAFSQNLAKLEAAFGTKLFTKQNNEWRPTETGNVFLEHSRIIVNEYHKMKSTITGLTTQEKQKIVFGISAERSALLLSSIYSHFTEEYPNYTILPITGAHNYLHHLAANESIDFVITALVSPTSLEQYRNLKALPLAKEELVLITPPDHPLGRSATTDNKVNVKNLDGEKFIQHGKVKNLYKIIHETFRQAEIHPTEIMYLDNPGPCINLVECGIGVSIVPHMLVEQNHQVHKFSLDPPLFWELCIVLNKNKRLSKCENRLIEMIREQI